MSDVEAANTNRSITRALTVLKVINKYRSLSMTQISRIAGLPYPTTFRIVETLMTEGYVAREQCRKHYRPTALVHSLSIGYEPEDRLATTAHPHIVDLTKRYTWPVSVCSRVGLRMMIRDSTHAMTPLTFSTYYPGYTMPLLDSSSGRVCVAFSSDQEKELLYRGMRHLDPARADNAITALQPTLDRIRETGYGTHERIRPTRNPGKTSSISVPMHEGDRLAGTMTLIFFSSTMPMQDAIDQFVQPLQQTAAVISAELAASCRPLM